MSTSAASRFSRSNTKSTPVEWCKSTDIGKLRRSADVYRSDGFITIPPVQNWSTSAPDHGLGVGGRFLIGSVRLPQRNPWNIVRGKPICKEATPILKTVHEPRHTGAGIQRSGSASSARARRVAADRNDAIRQGVTGHNARYVLGFGLSATIVAFIIVYLLYFG